MQIFQRSVLQLTDSQHALLNTSTVLCELLFIAKYTGMEIKSSVKNKNRADMHRMPIFQCYDKCVTS